MIGSGVTLPLGSPRLAGVESVCAQAMLEDRIGKPAADAANDTDTAANDAKRDC